MSSYNARHDQAFSRQLRVQRLSIPFKIIGNATPASVSPSNDEPSVLFLKTASVDQITGALSENEVATYSVAPADATGIFNILVKIRESLEKVVGAMVVSRTDGVFHPCFLGSSSGITTGTGSESDMSIMLTCDSSVALNASNTLDACLEVLYIVE